MMSVVVLVSSLVFSALLSRPRFPFLLLCLIHGRLDTLPHDFLPDAIRMFVAEESVNQRRPE
jgi:hypothetical protein